MQQLGRILASAHLQHLCDLRGEKLAAESPFARAGPGWFARFGQRADNNPAGENGNARSVVGGEYGKVGTANSDRGDRGVQAEVLPRLFDCIARNVSGNATD